MICAVSRRKDAEHRKLAGATQLFLPPEEPNFATTLYPRNLATLIVFILTSLDIVSLDTFFRILIRSTMWIHGRKLYNQPRNQGV